MNIAALWFFVLGGSAAFPPGYHPVFESARLGPLTEAQCREVQSVLPGQCLHVIGARTCNINDRTSTVCPILEGEMVR